MITVASFGGGTDSTAMLIGCWLKGLKVDLILFADTGGEKPHTYEHIYWMTDWLLKHDMPRVTWVKPFGNKTLETDCLERKALPSIAYGFKTCSQRFKLQPQDKYMNNWQPSKDAWKRGEKVTKLIGYEFGEQRRARDFSDKKYDLRYPLIEWEWDRKRCQEVIKQYAPEIPIVRKSACFFCPSTKAQEVKQLASEYPDLAARAIAMEKNANLTDIKGLGRNYAWADLLAFDDAQVKLFDDDWSTAEVPCGCYDGA